MSSAEELSVLPPAAACVCEADVDVSAGVSIEDAVSSLVTRRCTNFLITSLLGIGNTSVADWRASAVVKIDLLHNSRMLPASFFNSAFQNFR